MFSHKDEKTGEVVFPKLEFVRLAIPRCVNTQSHFDYVVHVLRMIREKSAEYRGYELTYAPELLRHFTARFKPL